MNSFHISKVITWNLFRIIHVVSEKFMRLRRKSFQRGNSVSDDISETRVSFHSKGNGMDLLMHHAFAFYASVAFWRNHWVERQLLDNKN
jgi:hypothetical protein